MYLNRTTTGEPDLASPVIVQEGTGDLVVSSGRSSVDVCDFNGDGRKDLVLGNTDAQLVFYPNVGTDEAPVFDGHETILATTGGVRSRPFVTDINGDGTVDALLGASDGLVRQYLGASSDTDYQAEFVVSSTVGHTTVFSNVSAVANRRAIPAVAGQAGTLDSITIYHQGGTGHAILAVYSDASGLPGTLLGVTSSTVIHSTEGWQTIALQSPVAVSAGQTIWLAWVFENDPGMRWTQGHPGSSQLHGDLVGRDALELRGLYYDHWILQHLCNLQHRSGRDGSGSRERSDGRGGRRAGQPELDESRRFGLRRGEDRSQRGQQSDKPDRRHDWCTAERPSNAPTPV